MDARQIRKLLPAVIISVGVIVIAFFIIRRFAGGALNAQHKDATSFTKKVNDKFLKELPFKDKEDFELTERGLIARPKNLVIKDKNGRTVWNMNDYSFIKKHASCPCSVNPSLWRQSKLNMAYGLYKVVDRIYQVRGFDLSNISFIQGDTGWIIIDPLISTECAQAALELANKHLGKRPVVAVIYSHSHADHFGGVLGVTSEQDVKDGKVKIIAPKGFMQSAITENVLAGNAMSRRATYMYGAFLPREPKGQVDAGLGKTNSTGTVSLIPPTDTIVKTGQRMTIDGVKMVFQNTPGTEAPADMNVHFPQFKTLYVADNCTASLHNIYTLRGAEVRDARAWAHYLEEAIELYGNSSNTVFGGHNWPRWGNKKVINYLAKQRDLYKYLHDQTLRLANHGYTMLEIAEMMTVPKELCNEWFNRDYYGTINHNVKAVYQKYLGFYDANPANLHPLPPEPAAKKYVEFMGGADAVIKKARESYKKGDYRWVAQVMNHVVFSDPTNREARLLEADAMEQLGYQAESGPWRCVYLVGAQELREGVKKMSMENTASPDTIKVMPIGTFFDFLGVRLNADKARGKTIRLNFNFTDTKEKYVLTVQNSVLNYVKNKQLPDAQATITLTRAALNDILLKKTTMDAKIASGELKVKGDFKKLNELMSLLDHFEFWFNIVTP